MLNDIFDSLKSSSYLGKGDRGFKEQRYNQALNCFLTALRHSKEPWEIAVSKEFIAGALRLGDVDNARLYASDSLAFYEKSFSKDSSDVFKKGIDRVKRLLNEIVYREKEGEEKNK